MAAGMGRAAAAPGEPNPFLGGPAAAVPPPCPLTLLPSPGAACLGERGWRSLEASALKAPSPTAGPLAPRRAVGPLLPPGGAEPGGHGSRSPPRRAPPRGDEAGRACSSSPGFCFPPGLTGPGFGSRQRSPTRPRPGAGHRSRPELTAREQPPPRAGEKLRLSGPGQPEKSSRGEPCAGTPRAQWSFAHLVEGEDNGVSDCRAPRLGVRSLGGGCGCAFTTFTCRPGKSDWKETASPLAGALGGCQRSAHSNR